jgi:hygromycin-B 7''-O-kinase
MLPASVRPDRYFPDVHGQPLPFWRGALGAIAARHGLPDGPWERAALGRNVVFLGQEIVVKLGPPCWPGEMAREAAALGFVAGRLPVQTPAALALGSLEGWEYLVQRRLPGASLHALWPSLPPAARAELALQQGALMAAIHALPIAEAPGALRFDWAGMLAEQRAECAPLLGASGVGDALLAQLGAYLDAGEQLIAAEQDDALVHGDLNYLNLLVEGYGEQLRITSLIDWGDVKLGPVSHELISPAVNMFRGDPALLRAWGRGYGWGDRMPERLARVATARVILYYADELGALLRRLPGRGAYADWDAVATDLWGL